MLIHYWQVALRNLIKQPLNSVIKIIGLALGLASALLVMLVNYSELTWDSFWPDADKIYFLREKSNNSNLLGFQDSMSEVYYRQLRAALSDRAWLTELRFNSATVSWEDESTHQRHSQQAMSVQVAADFIAIFQPQVIAGDLSEFALNPNSAFITRKTALQLFGEQDPIGKVVMIPARKRFVPGSDNQTQDVLSVRIIAVVDMDHTRSQIPSGIYYVNLDYPLINGQQYYELLEVYIKPKQEFDKAAIAAGIKQTIDQHLPDDPVQRELRRVQYQLMSIADRHLQDSNSSGIQKRILMLGLLGVLILVVALSNFINLGLAGYVARQKEVALRRIHGASKLQLFWQYWLEALLYVGIACLLALIGCELFLPQLKSDLQIPLVDGLFVEPGLVLGILVIVLLASCVIALYPAMYFTGLSAASILRANRSAESPLSIYTRKLLLLMQFVVVSGLMVGLASIHTQLRVIDSYQPGYKTRDIVMLIDRSGFPVSESQIGVITQQLKQLPGFIAGSRILAPIPGANNHSESVTAKINNQVTTVNTVAEWYLSPDYFPTLGIPLVAGSRETLAAGFQLTPEGASPSTQVVLCRSTARQLGFKSPQDALGQPVEIFKRQGMSQGMESSVRAVIEDIHLGSHKLAPKPCMYLQVSEVFGGMPYAINMDHAPSEQEINTIKSIWAGVAGTAPHHWLFAGSIADQYRQERNVQWFMTLFVLVALVIGLLGVYGMTALSTQKRAREIALRKLHGASAWQIVGVINRDLARIVIIANVLAWPLVVYLAHSWLDNFHVRFSLATWLPVFCGAALALCLLTVWLTASSHSFIQGQLRPADALRNPG